MDIPTIKTQLTLKTVLAHYGLKPDKHLRLHCPFHQDKTPSLQVYYKTHTCYCFSSNCSTHGKSMDVIDFIMHKEQIDKHQALEKAKQLITGNATPVASITKSAVLTKMFTYFKNAVHNSEPAKQYLENRSLDYTQIAVGYNTGQFHHGTRKDKALIESCIKVGLLLDKGHVNNRTGEKAFSPFGKGGIVFPLRNKQNQIISLYFRSITNNTTQKHFYLKDRSGLYPKYPSSDTQTLILTESIIDTATLQQHASTLNLKLGTLNFLALYGTNGLTSEHIEAIQSLKALKEIILFFDGDQAGKSANEKYGKQLKALLPDVTIGIVNTPDDYDINSLLKAHSPAIFTGLLKDRSLFLSIEKESAKSNPQPKVAETLNSKLGTPVLSTVEGLNLKNEQYITYTKESLKFTLLGGLNISQSDRMRVTLKLNIEPQLSPLQSIRHNIDLYNDDQVEKFIRKSAEKLEVGTSQIQQAVGELIELLEQYRLDKLKKQAENSPNNNHHTTILTEARKKAALDYLKAPNLLKRTNEDIAKSGVVGEEINRLLMYLVFTSRLRQQPLHVISLGASGTGKTYLQEKIAELIPEEDKLEITILSDNAFYYFGKQELQNKLILIEDMDGAENVLYPLRELMSKKRITKTLPIKDSKGNLRTITLQVEGPICLAGTTTKERIYEDNANRSLLLYLDGSKQHQEKIMDYQRRLSAGRVATQAENEIKEQFKDIQRLLKPIKVVNPYAPQLKIPNEIFKPLRTNTHYLQFIECITFYHQYQRQSKLDTQINEPYIETTLEDIAVANQLLKDVLLAKADELSGACRKFFEVLKAHLRKEEKSSFYGKEIRLTMRISYPTLKRYLFQLTMGGYIKIVGGDKYRKGYEYEITDLKEYQSLQHNITNALDKALEEIKASKAKSGLPTDLSVRSETEAEASAKRGSVAHSSSIAEVSH